MLVWEATILSVNITTVSRERHRVTCLPAPTVTTTPPSTTIILRYVLVLIIFFTLPGEQTDPGPSPIRILNHKSFLKIFVFAKVPDLSPVLEV